MAEIKHQIPINATPEKVFAALATSTGLRGWWTADSKAEEQAGGKAEFGFDNRGMVFRMTVEKLDPAKQVVWTCQGDHPEWNGTTLIWNIAPEGRRNGAPLHPQRLEVSQRSLRDVQLDMGRTDVSAQELCRERPPGPALARIVGLNGNREVRREEGVANADLYDRRV